ncbi:hypothetical protein KR054_010669, partial [Drosophila jambulina]
AASPGGKCNTCPCGTTGGAPMQPSHRAPTCCGPPQQQQQMDTCQVQAPQIPTTCQVPQYQRPQVECTCTQNRVRNVRPQPIQANVVTCSRPVRPEPVLIEAPRCNCREMREAQIPPPQPKPCTCAPLQQPQPCHTTHVHMPCANNQVSTRGPVPYRRQACAHCRSTQRRKKCVIQ